MPTTVTYTNTAITVSVTETGGSSLAQMTAAINNTAVMEAVGSVYTIKQGVGVQYARLVSINSGTRINIATNETLVFVHGTEATNRYVFTISGELHAEGDDWVLDLGGSATFTNPSINVAFGKLYLKGNSGHHGTFKNYGTYAPTAQLINNTSQLYIDYVNIQDARIAGAVLSISTASYNYPFFTIKNVVFEQVVASTSFGGTLSLSGLPCHLAIIENVTFRLINGVTGLGVEIVKFKDCLFSRLTANSPSISGTTRGIGKNQYNNNSVGNPYDHDNQSYILYDNCIFESNYYGNANKVGIGNIYYNAFVKIKNCTFRKETSSTLYRCISDIHVGATVVFVGTNTFSDYTNVKWNKNAIARTLFGKEVTILIKDSSNNPIQNANVLITQSQGKDNWFWKTNSAGYVKDVFGDDCFLIEKEDTSTYGTGTYTQFSDSIASGRYHTITVTSPGKKTYTANFELTSTTSFTITLNTLAAIKRYDGANWVDFDVNVGLLT